jgi:N-acylneuraminate cytidylyltransferase
MMGRAGSAGFPNKNIKKVLGRRLFEYPLRASKNSQNVDKIFVTTDCSVITRINKK